MAHAKAAAGLRARCKGNFAKLARKRFASAVNERMPCGPERGTIQKSASTLAPSATSWVERRTSPTTPLRS
jgi:hypothetical protein